jgi:hypothetical protein
MRKQNSYAHKYHPVRLKVPTYDALIGWTIRAVAAYQKGQAPRWWAGDEPTPDEAIAELVRRSSAKRKRSERCCELRRERRANGQVEA